MNKDDRSLHRAIFIDRLKQHCENSIAEAKNFFEEKTKFRSGFLAGVKSEAEYVLEFIKGFEVSLTNDETKVIELLRIGLNERAEQDCDYEDYYGREGCPEFITRHHYQCDGCRAREILKEIEQLEKDQT